MLVQGFTHGAKFHRERLSHPESHHAHPGLRLILDVRRHAYLDILCRVEVPRRHIG
jgi:hypothetical protein